MYCGGVLNVPHRKCIVVGYGVPGDHGLWLLESQRPTVDGESGAGVGCVAIKSNRLGEPEHSPRTERMSTEFKGPGVADALITTTYNAQHA